MRTHQEIDRRSLALARLIVERIDGDPERAGLEDARRTCRRWLTGGDSLALREWLEILEGPWEEIRSVLLDPGERGQRLRQSSPFCGVLTPQERWEVYRSFEKPRDRRGSG